MNNLQKFTNKNFKKYEQLTKNVMINTQNFKVTMTQNFV